MVGQMKMALKNEAGRTYSMMNKAQKAVTKLRKQKNQMLKVAKA